MFKLKYAHFVFFLFLFLVILSIFVATGDLKHFDLFITTKVQSIVPRNLDVFMSVFSVLGTAEISTLFLLAMLLIFKASNWFKILFLYAGGEVVEILGKIFIKHPSPPKMFFRYDLGVIFPSNYVQTGYSYPSGHIFRVTFIILILIVLIYKSKNLDNIKKHIFKFALIIFIILMIISRIYLGEHWATDVIAGLILGSLLRQFANNDNFRLRQSHKLVYGIKE